MLEWKKLGLVFRPDPTRHWMRSHAQLPTPVVLGDGRCRVFFASRDARQRSHVGWFDVHLDDPTAVLDVSEEPVLSPGKPGFFDADGIYVASAVRLAGGALRFYTIGWNAGTPPPMFYASIGVAESHDAGKSSRKIGQAPVMARSEHDPCLVTSPVVLPGRHGYRMWYVSGYEWVESGARLESRYHVKYAESDDGVLWRREGRICLDCERPQETNISRFWVVPWRGEYHAWYGYDRGAGYRIGYARSQDGLAWDRRDNEAGIGPSASGWDCEALSYPAVVQHGRRWFMFYNGNQFGSDGVGLAVAELEG